MSEYNKNYKKISTDTFLSLLSGADEGVKSSTTGLMERIKEVKKNPSADEEFKLVASVLDECGARFDPLLCNSLIFYLDESYCLSRDQKIELLMEVIITNEKVPLNGKAVLLHYYLQALSDNVKDEQFGKFLTSRWKKVFAKVKFEMPLLYADLCFYLDLQQTQKIVGSLAKDLDYHIDILSLLERWIESERYKGHKEVKLAVDKIYIDMAQAFKKGEYHQDIVRLIKSYNITSNENDMSDKQSNISPLFRNLEKNVEKNSIHN